MAAFYNYYNGLIRILNCLYFLTVTLKNFWSGLEVARSRTDYIGLSILQISHFSTAYLHVIKSTDGFVSPVVFFTVVL